MTVVNVAMFSFANVHNVFGNMPKFRVRPTADGCYEIRPTDRKDMQNLLPTDALIDRDAAQMVILNQKFFKPGQKFMLVKQEQDPTSYRKDWNWWKLVPVVKIAAWMPSLTIHNHFQLDDMHFAPQTQATYMEFVGVGKAQQRHMNKQQRISKPRKDGVLKTFKIEEGMRIQIEIHGNEVVIKQIR